MSKRPKISQTDYTRGGRDISNTAIPLYQQNLTQLGNYMNNIQNRLDPYLEKYVNQANAAQNSDFLRDYQRAMGQATAGNYAATTGGYSSANQLGYDDQQRYYNDLAARMYSQGLGMASELANQEWTMLANTPQVYNQAYKEGKAYSDTQRYNDMVDQLNDNWWSNALTSVGDSIGAISMNSNNPWVMAIGGSIGGTMGAAGRMFGYDDSALSGLRDAAVGAQGNQQYSGGGNNTNNYASSGLSSLFKNYDWFNSNPLQKSGGTNTSGVSGNSMSNFMGFKGLGK